MAPAQAAAGGGGAGPHRDRPRLAVDALRGDAVVAAVLQFAARRHQDAAARRHRSGRHRAQPGGADRRRRACASRSTPRRASRRCRRGSSPSTSAPACSTSPSPPTTSSRRCSGCAPTASTMLPMPENYYDDLEARTDLSRRAARRAARAQHPLRPRRGRRISPGLHRDFEDLFFFEIVERRGYQGFGAVNASIRLAAQARLSGGAME